MTIEALGLSWTGEHREETWRVARDGDSITVAVGCQTATADLETWREWFDQMTLCQFTNDGKALLVNVLRRTFDDLSDGYLGMTMKAKDSYMGERHGADAAVYEKAGLTPDSLLFIATSEVYAQQKWGEAVFSFDDLRDMVLNDVAPSYAQTDEPKVASE